MTKQEKIESFDPSQPGMADNCIFGLPFTADESEIIIIPVPWEVTVSYGSGAGDGPKAIMDASSQVDLNHQLFPELWKLGMYMDFSEQSKKWNERGEKYKQMAHPIIKALEKGEILESFPVLQEDLEKINNACRKLHDEVRDRTLYWTQRGKKVILLGGDHSTPQGYYEALASEHHEFGILHIDAHMDLRIAYEGFKYSHASIMYNAIQLPQVSKIVQVGIRDFSEQEVQVIANTDKVIVHTDADLKAGIYEGRTWRQQCDEIIGALPQKVVVSFDIDGLQQWYCPSTGTPVPGGLSFEQAIYLLTRLGESGKEIIGMDLVEVAPGETDWDGNVGARLLFHMCGVLAKSSRLATGDMIRFRK